MATIVLRTTKGSPLTIAEVDSNFNNLNNFKLEITGATGSATLPVGTTAQRDVVPAAGFLRFNSTAGTGELFTGSTWLAVGAVSVGDDSTNATYYPTLSTTLSGTSTTLRVSSTRLTFNPSSGVLSATSFSGSGASLTSLNASNLSSGTVPTTRLAGGTASVSNFLRGDQNWAAVTAGDITSGTFGAARLGSGTATNTTYLRGDQVWSSVNWAHISNKPSPTVTVTLTGDVTGSASATLTELASGTVTIATTASSIAGDLVVSGNLTVNGTTTTVNSTITTLDDPVITLGGNTAPITDDNKDRGVEFRWHDGSTAKTGFFGFDDSTGKFTFIPDATNTSEAFAGAKGTIDATIEWADVLSKPSFNSFATATVADTDLGHTWSETGSAAADTAGGTLTFVSGTDINIDVSSTTDAIRVTHRDIARTNTTSNESPSNGGSFIVVDGVTTSARGHVTAVNVKTVTLPPSVNPTVVNDTATDTTYYPTMSAATSGNFDSAFVSNTKLAFNPSTGTLSATNFNSLSDETLKTDVETIATATTTIRQLRGVEYRWKETGNKSAGVIAQEIEQVLPHLVEDKDGLKTVNYSGIIAYLIEAIKSQDERIAQLESLINK